MTLKFTALYVLSIDVGMFAYVSIISEVVVVLVDEVSECTLSKLMSMLSSSSMCLSHSQTTSTPSSVNDKSVMSIDFENSVGYN